jgi:uncharacterized tellurite resistance protein B-like protein
VGFSLRALLGLPDARPAPASDVESIRRIGEALERMDPIEARRLACFAFVLARVAHADLEISPEETAAMERIVRDHSGLPEAQAAFVVEIAKAQNRLLGATDNYLVTRQFREATTQDERRGLLHCVLAVAAADDSISAVEDAEIRKIAAELGFGHEDFIAARSRFRDKLAVLKPRDAGS